MKKIEYLLVFSLNLIAILAYSQCSTAYTTYAWGQGNGHYADPYDPLLTYEWLDCNNGNTVVETGGSFYPSVSGSYALRVSGACGSNTSACFTFYKCDANVTNSGVDLNAPSVTTSTYQWLDCNNNFAAIPGENSNTFVPTVSGTYSLAVATDGCTDTAMCIVFTVSSCDASATFAGTGLTASSGATQTYQWLDCNNGYAAIPGATSSSYVPTISGSYALAVSAGGCADTSSCLNYIQCDATVSFAGTGLNVTSGATQTYQWLDCNNGFSAIPGATSSTYSPIVNGNYALAVSTNGCVDTSQCFNVGPCNGFSASFTVSQIPGDLFNITMSPVVNQVNANNNVHVSYSFGDGTTINIMATDAASHSYPIPGEYEICMYVTDSTFGCFASFCDTITLDSSGIMSNRGVNTAFSVNINPVTFNVATGTESIESESAKFTDIILYPNPVNNILNLDLSGSNTESFKIQVININGKVILDKLIDNVDVNSHYQLDVKSLSAGMYYLRYLSVDNTISVPFKKQ